MRHHGGSARSVASGADQRDGQHGQVIVLFAFSLVALLLVVALVLDVARAYAALRYQSGVADAAALAGAQDLQDLDASGNTTMSVSTADYPVAQCDAYNLLVRQLAAPPPPAVPATLDCTSATVLNGFGWSATTTTYTAVVGSYTVQITTPYPPASNGDRAVKVGIRQTNFGLTFGNAVCLLPGSGCVSGAPSWSPAVASVAGGGFGGQYAVVTLRGSHWLKKQDANYDDITLTGGSTLNVVQGDVGTNTDLVTNGCGTSSASALILASGAKLDHYDDISVTWCNPVPKDHVIQFPVPDPDYWATASSALSSTPPTYSTASAAQDAGCANVGGSASPGLTLTDIGKTYSPANWPGLTKAGDLSTTNTVCYKPGIYTFDIHNTSNTTVVLLEPGMYWFNAGLTMYGPMIGGYAADQPGVTLVFPEGSQCTATGGSAACNFAGNNSPLVALNMGSCTPSSVASSPLCAETSGATPAPSWDATTSTWTGSPVAQVSFAGPHGSTITVPETLIVTHDPGCYVQADATEPTSCSDTSNNVLNIPGGGSLYVAGVQYAPSDNVHISGGSGSNGTVGQIIAWTVTYNGSATVNEFYPGSIGNMVLRLDTVCSPGAACP